jgi:hypothetical protein
MPEYNDAAEPDKKPEKKPAAKMKTSSTKGDAIDKGKTITGSKPDIININPELQRNEARAFAEIAKIYDKVVGESINSAGGGAVRGLGYVTGNPLTDQDSENNYVNANIASADTHDNILKGIRSSMHDSLHAKFNAAVKESLDITNTHNREVGTDSLTQIYKASTPGQGVNMDFAFRFKDPKKSKEAVTRSGQPREKMDLVPRMDPGRNRKTDSDFYRQQSIVKKVVDETFNEAFGKSKTQGKNYKSPWDKIEKAKPGIGKRIDTAASGLKQNAKDYENIVNKEKTNEELVSELTKKFMNNFVARMIASHPETMKMTAKGHNVRRKKALDLAMDKLNPMSAIHKPKVLATEENLDEISRELVGRVNTLRTLGPDIKNNVPPKPHKTKAGYETLKKAVDKAAGVKRASTYTLPKVTEDATKEKDPLAHLEDRLNKAGDVSHNAVDKIMREVARDFSMDVHDLHNKWVSKYKITPDQYVKEDYQTPVTIGKLASPNHYSAIKDIALNTKNRNLTIKEYSYGPMDPNDEKNNVQFWKDKADMWNTTVEAAREARCGNCAVFNQSQKVLKMIEDAIGENGVKVQKEANLGFCELFEFKCAAARTCDAWIMNGPLKEDKKPWNTPNPKKKHHHLSPAKIAMAKARARAAGRPYPNFVDNMAVAKESIDDAFLNAMKEDKN